LIKHIFSLFIICFFLPCSIAYADFENDVLALVNAERSAEGLGPLGYDACLAEAARGHSEDMGVNDYFDHLGLDDSTPGDRITAAGYPWYTCGENIAASKATPEAVMVGWMDSPGHRANILNPDFCDIGVGYAYISHSTYGHYWTQNFGCSIGTYDCTEASTYIITALAGSGGSIDPDGAVPVDEGSNLTFTITADTGFRIDALTVDSQPAAIGATFTFTNVTANHTINVTFALNQFPPAASAGSDQTVTEGDTVTLDGSGSSDPDDAVVDYLWSQKAGPDIALSDETAVKPTFTAWPVDGDSEVVFELEVSDSGGLSDVGGVVITVHENGIIEDAPGAGTGSTGSVIISDTASEEGGGGCFVGMGFYK